MIGPQCPACGAKVKLPKNAPLPPPHAKVRCPSCGSVGELEAFLTAAASAGEPSDEIIEDAEPASEITAKKAPPPRPADLAGGTRVSGSASALNLPAGLRCALTVISGPDRGKKMEIHKPRIVVGRNNGDFPLSDEEISTEHCAFEITGVTCTVKDLDSRNGTYVDGERVQRHQLSTVGEVVVGGTTILFTMTLEDAIPAG
ncbi:MAG: FHA domain-containing protein [Acidobacteria bacterium]|nr:FHA domain-containing protein [Acidobacteriota bacterium]